MISAPLVSCSFSFAPICGLERPITKKKKPSEKNDNLTHAFEQVVPDTLEILPGLMPGIIRRLCATVPVPIIAGGLLSEKSDIVSALSAGAMAVSTTNEALWDS